jgi:hypothetical protein
VPFWTPRLLFAALVLCLASLSPGVARAAPEPEGSQARDGARALVVLIGEAAKSDELTSVLSELLGREQVALEFERRSRFRPSSILAANQGDSRVWVYVSSTNRIAKLYFRGPSGNRFLLRKLQLPRGLDEVGRELIAQVVETSVLTLLRSEAGLSREQVRADLADTSEPRDENSSEDALPAADEASASVAQPPVPTAEEPAVKPARSALELELAARGVVEWTGSDLGADHGVGAETGLSYHFPSALFVRARLVFEQGLGQGITTPALSATVRTTALRGGIDVGFAFGPSALALGAGFGVDLARIEPETAFDASLVLADETSSTIPVLRLEVRYELTAGIFQMAAGVFADVPLVDTHYDVRGNGGLERVAEPWAVRPGALLTLGFSFDL